MGIYMPFCYRKRNIGSEKPLSFCKYRKGGRLCQAMVLCCLMLFYKAALFYSTDLINEFHTAVHSVIGSGEGIVILGYGSSSFHTVDHFLELIGI